MKPCKTFLRKLISRYIDNDLTHEELSLLQRHMVECAECRETLDAYVSIKKMTCTCFPVVGSAALTLNPARMPYAPVVFKPRMQWAFALAAAIIFSIALVSGFAGRFTPLRHAPDAVVAGTSSNAVMNAPMGSIVYYQEFAGNAVHSQFVDLGASTETDIGQENETGTQKASYESPLFDDDINTLQFASE